MSFYNTMSLTWDGAKHTLCMYPDNSEEHADTRRCYQAALVYYPEATILMVLFDMLVLRGLQMASHFDGAMTVVQ